MNIKKLFGTMLVAIAGLFVFATPASAHVVVKPGEVGVGQRINFAVSVPTEKEVPTVSVRLLIPEGLTSVRPNAKPGWTIQLKKVGEGEEVKVTEIVWSGGRIPADQRDEFVFSAQAPSETTSLVWKAYQTYADGDVVSWDKDPKVVEEHTKNMPKVAGMKEHDHDMPMPYSVTNVINDLKSSGTPITAQNSQASSEKGSKVLSIVAILLSVVALGMQLKKKI